jgi:hypothetical protein
MAEEKDKETNNDLQSNTHKTKDQVTRTVYWVQQKIQQLAYVCNGVFFPKKCEWSRLNYLKWLV